MYTHSVDWQVDPALRTPARVNPVCLHPQEQRRSLDGPWQFRLDPADEGRRARWFAQPGELGDTIQVPGCWQGQGFGGDGPDTPWDFGLPARVFRATYQGTAWYGKRFPAPAEWRGRRVWLNVGGVHPAAEVWLNGRRLGGHSGPFVPFALEATGRLRPGDNFLAVRVHEANRWLGLAYNWMGCWSGLYRSVELTATGPAWLERCAIHPHLGDRRLRCRVMVAGAVGPGCLLAVTASDHDGRPVAQRTCRVRQAGEYRLSLPVAEPRPWSPETPELYRVEFTLTGGGQVADALVERVGFVALSTKGKHVLINGEPYYLRGTGDFLVNPETGSPDTDRDRWRRKLATLRAYGYNYVRCQSYVPAPEYYDAADEVGLLVQSEMGMLGAWAGADPWHRYPWPPPTPRFHDALQWQWDRTVERDLNHPSAALYCMSNELGRDTLFPEVAWQCYRATKARKPSALVIWTDGGLNGALPGDFVNDEADKDGQTPLPLIQHEFRWWSSYPDVRIKGKYQGAVRPYAITTAEAAARRHGLAPLLPEMAHASQQLQYVEARTKMESCRRDHPRLAGICHFNAMDAGYSPQGILDEFYDRKLVSAETWRRTNGDTVVMVDRGFDDRVLVGGSRLRCRFSVSDFSHPPLRAPELQWQLLAGERMLAAGRRRYRHQPFCTCPAGQVSVRLPHVAAPALLTLRAAVTESGRAFGNEWSFWLFPAGCPPAADAALYGRPGRSWLATVRSIPPAAAGRPRPPVVLAAAVDDTLAEHCRQGGRLIVAAPPGVRRPFPPKLGGGTYFFLPPANYPPLEDGHSGAIVRHHPMLGGFPHAGFADLQLYRLISPAPPIDLAALGLGRVEPVVRPLATYFVAEPLAYLVEVSFGRGGLILCALHLDQALPEARYLLAQLVAYAGSRGFRPAAELSAQGWARLAPPGGESAGAPHRIG